MNNALFILYLILYAVLVSVYIFLVHSRRKFVTELSKKENIVKSDEELLLGYLGREHILLLTLICVSAFMLYRYVLKAIIT